MNIRLDTGFHHVEEGIAVKVSSGVAVQESPEIGAKVGSGTRNAHRIENVGLHLWHCAISFHEKIYECWKSLEQGTELGREVYAQ